LGPPCTSNELRVHHTGSSGGAGTFFDLFTIQNVSEQLCSISGYPVIQFGSVHGRLQPQAVLDRVSASTGVGDQLKGPLPTVNLAAHSGVASFLIEEHDNPIGLPPSTCYGYNKIIVTPPRSLDGEPVLLGFDQIYGASDFSVV
jgi:hypothetical protein